MRPNGCWLLFGVAGTFGATVNGVPGPSGPSVLIASPAPISTSSQLNYIVDWNQNVGLNSNPAQNFQPNNLIVQDQDGNRLPVRSCSEYIAPDLSTFYSTSWFGDLARVPLSHDVPTLRRQAQPNQRFQCSVQGPAQGVVEAQILGNVVCSTQGLCNTPSNLVRTQINPAPGACMQVAISSNAEIVSGTSFAVVVDFSSDVLAPVKLEAWAYSFQDRALPSSALQVGSGTGTVRKKTFVVAVPSDPRLNRIEVYIRQGTIKDYAGIGNCESNHFRLETPTVAYGRGEFEDGAVTHKKLALDSVYNENVLDLAVTTVKLANAAITTPLIRNAAVTKLKLADNSLSQAVLAENAVTANIIQANSIPAGKLGFQAVTKNKVNDGAVSGPAVGVGAVTSGKIAPSSVRGINLENGAVTAKKLNLSNIPAELIEKGSIYNAQFATGAITSNKLANDAVTTNRIKGNVNVALFKTLPRMFVEGSVTTKKLDDGSVTPYKIGDRSVAGDVLKNEAVTSKKFVNNTITMGRSSVTGDKIADHAVTAEKLADDAVRSVNILANTITVADLANGAASKTKIMDRSITSPHIEDGAITNDKLANGAVATGNLGDAAVTNRKLADKAILARNLYYDSLTRNKIQPDTVTTAHLANNSVTMRKLSSNILSASSLDGMITTKKIVDQAVTPTKIAHETDRKSVV